VPLSNDRRDMSTAALLEASDPTIQETIQKQMQDVLTRQTETVMLQKQIEVVEEETRVARRQRRSATSYTAAKRSVFHKFACMPEQNRNLLRQVAERERELNELRRAWWKMRSSGSTTKRSLCQTVVKALLGGRIDASQPAPPLPLESMFQLTPSTSTIIVTDKGFILTPAASESPSRMPSDTLSRMPSDNLEVPTKPEDHRVRRQSSASPNLVEAQSPSRNRQFRAALSPRHPSALSSRQRNLDLGSLHISSLSKTV